LEDGRSYIPVDGWDVYDMRGRPLAVPSHVGQTGEVRVLVHEARRLPGLQEANLLQALTDVQAVLEQERTKVKRNLEMTF
jgi:hypothetical protein